MRPENSRISSRVRLGTGDDLATNSLLRHINALRCLRVLRRAVPMSRADIARELGITRATVGNSIKPLLESGLLIELEEQGEVMRAGRPSVLVALNPNGAYFIGIDISTTAINAVLVDFAMNVVSKQVLSISDRYRDASRVVDLLADLPQKLIAVANIRKKQIHGVCVSVPGIVRNGCVISAPWMEWQDVELRDMLSKRMKAGWSVEVCNDSVALASAIRADAGENDMQDVLLILLAQGIGSAHIRQGRILEGAHGFAGEIGHMVMGTSGKLALSQTFEIMAGYERFRHLIPAGHSIADGLAALSLIEKPNKKLATLLAEWAEILAAGLLNLIHILDPQQIVLGGPLAVLFPAVEKVVRAELALNLVHGFVVPPISVARFGADGAAIGAAAMLRDTLFTLPELAPT